ncbi:MAG TPA: protein-glutamate O-methyltransferase CheR [Polyangiales bacterium]
MQTASFERIRALVKERAAIVIEPSQQYLVESRLEPIAKARGYRSVDEMCNFLRTAGADLINELVEAMTTNETSFFRDHVPFEALRTDILPELIELRAATRTLEIWCAAASTGQEPYSLALTIREHFPDLASWNVRILATDISRPVLEKARNGRYRQVEVNRGVSANYLHKYFKRDGIEFEIDRDLRKMVRFDELNLIQTWPLLPTFDLIFLRNVLIYFDVEAKRSILSRAHRQLAGDGYMFLGGSEALPGDDLGFERLPIARAGCYRRTQPARKERHRASK